MNGHVVPIEQTPARGIEAPDAVLPPGRPVMVWDRCVRVLHWTLVLCILGNLFVLKDGETAHQVAGYLAVAVVLSRLAWGWLGTPHARFASFVPTLARVRAYLSQLRRGADEPTMGHNPLGALMVLALLAVLLLLGLTGFLQTTDMFWGEDWLERLHEGLAKGLELLCLLHVAAVVVMSRRERVNLARAMVTGVKLRRPQ